MGMVEKFLQKQDNIQNAYHGKAKVTTYCIAVLNKMCCELIRKELKQWKQQSSVFFDNEHITNSHPLKKLVINDEVKLLYNTLLLFDNERIKVQLFLAYLFQLSLIKNDLVVYDKNYKKNKLDILFSQINLKNKSEIFKNLTYAVEVAENKFVKHDAVRMWLNKNITRIIVRLNGPFNRANYDKETLQILFEYYHNQRKENETKKTEEVWSQSI